MSHCVGILQVTVYQKIPKLINKALFPQLTKASLNKRKDLIYKRFKVFHCSCCTNGIG